MTPAVNSIGVSLSQIAPWTEQALLVGVASARFGFAFVLMPLFSTQLIPALVRNSIIIAFGLIALSLPIRFDPSTLTAGGWAWLYAKEAVAGVTIGFFFGTLLWAMAAAGEIIDTKVGATMAQILDPLSNTQQPLTATLLGRFAQVMFVSAGGLTVLVGTVMLSFAVWPLGPGAINANVNAVSLFEAEFGRLFAIAFIIASPALILLYVIDAGLGLLNRFAQQFNVFTLSLPIKSAAALFVTILILPLLGQLVVRDLGERQAVPGAVLRQVGEPARAPLAPAP